MGRDERGKQGRRESKGGGKGERGKVALDPAGGTHSARQTSSWIGEGKGNGEGGERKAREEGKERGKVAMDPAGGTHSAHQTSSWIGEGKGNGAGGEERKGRGEGERGKVPILALSFSTSSPAHIYKIRHETALQLSL